MRTSTAAVAAYEEPVRQEETRRSLRLTRTQVIIVIASALIVGAVAGALAAVQVPQYQTSR